MIEKFYHYYNVNAEPRVTVCLLYDETSNSTARGIAVCSRKDRWDDICVLPVEDRDLVLRGEYTVGQFLAKQQAVRALRNRKVDDFNNQAVIKRLVECEVPFTKKAEKDPDLAFFERRMLFGKNFHKHSYYEKPVMWSTWVEPKEYDIEAEVILYEGTNIPVGG